LGGGARNSTAYFDLLDLNNFCNNKFASSVTASVNSVTISCITCTTMCVPFSELFFLHNNYDNDFKVCCLTFLNYFLVLEKLLNFTYLVIFYEICI
jgi:hypothetical protein